MSVEIVVAGPGCRRLVEDLSSSIANLFKGAARGTS